MEEVTKSRGRMTIFTTNKWSRTAGRGYRSFIHGSFIRVRRSGFGTNAADTEKGALVSPNLRAFKRSWD
jgi:hypothetical protein